MSLYKGAGRRVGCSTCHVEVPLSRIQNEPDLVFPHRDDCTDKNPTYTDCKSDEGITVGLIDTMITAARVLRGRDLKTHAIKEALKDLQTDSDVLSILESKNFMSDNVDTLKEDRNALQKKNIQLVEAIRETIYILSEHGFKSSSPKKERAIKRLRVALEPDPIPPPFVGDAPAQYKIKTIVDALVKEHKITYGTEPSDTMINTEITMHALTLYLNDLEVRIFGGSDDAS